MLQRFFYTVENHFPKSMNAAVGVFGENKTWETVWDRPFSVGKFDVHRFGFRPDRLGSFQLPAKKESQAIAQCNFNLIYIFVGPTSCTSATS